MLKKILWIFAAVTVIFLFEQCQKDEGYDCGDPPPYYLLKTMRIFHRIEDLQSRQIKNMETNAITIDTAERYHIICDFDVEYTTSAKLRNSSVLFNSAFASDPCPTSGYRGSKYPMSEIRITSNADYDSAHLKGTILNSFFRAPYSDSLQASEYEFHFQRFSIISAKKPALDSVHTFKIEVLLKNGDKFSGETAAVTFKKK